MEYAPTPWINPPRRYGPAWLHFLLLGGLLFSAERFLSRFEPEVLVLRISALQQQALRDDFLRRSGHPPSAEQLRSLTATYLRDELLYREALRLRLDRGDAAVRRRVIQKVRFVSARPERPDDQLYQEGIALGLDRDDIVIRRRLIEKLRLSVRRADPGPPPNDEALQRYLDSHPDLYRVPERFTFSHIYFSRDRHGSRLTEVVDGARARLQGAAPGPEIPSDVGDALALARHQPARSLAQVRRLFGEQFVQRLPRLPTERWTGPIPSAYGVHLVWLQRRAAAERPSLASLRPRLVERVVAERGGARLAEYLANLTQAYVVELEQTGG